MNNSKYELPLSTRIILIMVIVSNTFVTYVVWAGFI